MGQKETMVVVPLFLLILLSLNSIDSARILGVFPTDTQSHYMMYGHLMRELALHGHDVTVLSLFPEGDKIKKLNDVGVNGTYELEPMTIEELLALGAIGNEFDIIKIGLLSCESVLKHQATKEILKQKFDLFITEVFGSECFLPIGHKLGIPTVGVITSVLLPWVNDIVATPDNPSYIPTYFSPYVQTMDFSQRVYNTVLNNIMKTLYNFYSLRPSQKIAENVFGSIPPLEDLAKNYSLLLVNSHNSINPVRPLVPQIIEVGGLHITKQLKDLPKDLKDFLDKSKTGVVYFSLGSIAQVETMKKDKLDVFVEVLGSLKVDVLWKVDGSLFKSLPPNVKTVLWTPQLEVLCHPNVKLFISHGGLLGMQEAIYCGVPILGMPMFADQGHNLAQAKKKGIAEVFYYETLSKDSFSKVLNDLLNKESYSKNAKHVSNLFRDRPLHPIDMAIYWIDYVIKYGGAYHLQSPALHMSWYQNMLVDVIIFIVLVILATVAVLCIVLKYAYNSVFKNKNLTTNHNNSKNGNKHYKKH